MDYSINGAVLAATHCNLCAIKQKEVIEVHADSVLFNFVSSFAFFAVFSSALLVTFYYHMRLSLVGACVAVGIQQQFVFMASAIQEIHVTKITAIIAHAQVLISF